jgi:head-tail adaptor
VSLLDNATTDTVQVFLAGVVDPVDVKCRVQPTSATATSTADGQAAVLQFRAVSRDWPAGVTEHVGWDARDWDVDGEPLRHHGSETTRHVTVLLRPRDVDDVTVLTASTLSDGYGNVLLNWGLATSVTVKALVQPVSTAEADDSTGRQQVSDEYDVWLPAGTVVTAQSRLLWRGLTLEVEGDPEVKRGVAQPRPVHVRARRVTG